MAKIYSILQINLTNSNSILSNYNWIRLSIHCSLSFIRRNGGGTPAHLQQVVSPSLNCLFKHTILHFCKRYDTYTIPQLIDDSQFMLHFSSLIQNNPVLLNRGLQSAIEVAYPKRRFGESDLRAVCGDRISLVDILGNNNGQCDSSTLYSVLQAHYLRSQFNNSECTIVVSTPLNANVKIDTLPMSTQNYLTASKSLTGNSFCDIILNGIHYDFKHKINPLENLNHIYMYDYETFLVKGPLLLKDVEKNFENQLQSLEITNGNCDFLKQAKTTLKEIRHSGTDTTTQVSDWNGYLLDTWSRRPTDVKIPLILATSDKPFVSDLSPSELALVELPNKPTIIAPDALKAVMGVLAHSSFEAKRAAAASTMGHLNLHSDNEVD
jgi:hypothetical protein